MQVQFNLAEILYLAEQGLGLMKAENPDMPDMLQVEPHIYAIQMALAFAGPKCLADYIVTLDLMDVFGD